jgi:hypothetical protein
MCHIIETAALLTKGIELQEWWNRHVNISFIEVKRTTIIHEGWNKNKHSIRAKGWASYLSISSSLLSTPGLLPGVKAEGTWSWPHVHLGLAWRTYAAVSSDLSIVPKCRLNLIMIFLSIMLCSLVDRYHVLEEPVSSVFSTEVRGNRFLKNIDICPTTGKSCN